MYSLLKTKIKNPMIENCCIASQTYDASRTEQACEGECEYMCICKIPMTKRGTEPDHLFHH